jgi:phosphate starvation-inducible protein PhoH
MNILKKMPQFSMHEFNPHDIVRSELVKSFIIEEGEYRDRTPDFYN